jgi:putative peptide zinc metalloprotease protein
MPTTYPPDAAVRVPPFQHRLEGDDTVTIGDIDRQAFISVPRDALAVIQDLAAGMTVGETARRYEARTGREVDIDGFIAALEEEGFVGDRGPAGEPEAAKKGRYLGHLNWITPQVARRIVSRPVVGLALVLITAMVGLVVSDPGVLPSFKALIYPPNLAILTWVTFAVGITTTMIHEFAHVIAARAAGVPSRIRLSNRMYIPVIETDMTGIWLAPKRARYLAFLAGLLVDAASLSIFIGALWAERRGLIGIPAIPLLVLKGVAVTYIGRIYWQGYLFVRTDFYYTLSTALDCKNLMTDTQYFIENAMLRLVGRRPVHDQSGLSKKERRSVRSFAALWVIGRGLAMLMLFWVTIPLLGHYLWRIFDFVTNPDTILSRFDFVTSVVVAASFSTFGLAIWGVKLARGARQRIIARRRRLTQQPATA